MEAVQEKAREVGRLIAQTDEYGALKRANQRLSDDRPTVELLNRAKTFQDELTDSIRKGEEPGREQQEEFEQVMSELQGQTVYQEVVAAQANFDRLMMRVNEEIARGIEAGEQSRIILS